MSDHRVQGMNLTNYIIDLRRPPNSRFRLENLYVMLSRATTWSDFAILCPFDDDIFLKNKPNEELQEYNQYLKDQDGRGKTIIENEQNLVNNLLQELKLHPN